VRVSRPLRAAAALAVIATTAALCAPPARTAEPQPHRVTIAFTADVSGYLEPCG
jgi:hypothetical protein